MLAGGSLKLAANTPARLERAEPLGSFPAVLHSRYQANPWGARFQAAHHHGLIDLICLILFQTRRDYGALSVRVNI
jgi:hypothetical protein